MNLFDFSVPAIGFFCVAYLAVSGIKDVIRSKIDRDIELYSDTNVGT